jgi:hypothetical protein
LILNTFPEVGYKVAKRKLIALLLKKVPTAAALGVNNVQKHLSWTIAVNLPACYSRSCAIFVLATP